MPCVLSTEFRTTSLGDVNWTVTVIHQTTTNVVDVTAIMDANHRGGLTEKFQSLKVTFKVTKGHPYWCHSTGDIRFPASLQFQLYF